MWSLECRLRRPGELGQKTLTGGDNAAAVGAMLRCRSSSIQLNAICRQGAAVELAGDFCNFDFWVPTDRNRADRPSRVHATSSKPRLDEPLPMSTLVPGGTDDLDVDAATCRPIFLVLCSGPRRCGDIADRLTQLCAEAGIELDIWCVDPSVRADFDLTDAKFVRYLLTLVRSGRVVGGFASPPCSTVGRARHAALEDPDAPRPVRSRADPFATLPGLSKKEVQQCAMGSHMPLSSS